MQYIQKVPDQFVMEPNVKRVNDRGPWIKDQGGVIKNDVKIERKNDFLWVQKKDLIKEGGNIDNKNSNQ